LNAHDEETYNRNCRPAPNGAFNGVVEFIKEAVKTVPEVVVTAVEMEGVDIEVCRRIASELGAKFKVRQLDRVG
ncbi:MAG: radical SAM protein, partial [Nitrospirae bacterium]